MNDTQIQPPTTSAPSEVVEIQRAMSDPASEYWRGQKDASGNTAMQTRYSEILRGQSAAAAVTTPPTDAETAELRSITDRMRTDRAGYFKDEAAQVRYRELVARQPGPLQVPSVIGGRASLADAEIARLKSLQADTRSEYWRGPNAERNQARYRELIEAGLQANEKAAAPVPEDETPAAPPMTEAQYLETDAGREILAEADEYGGIEKLMRLAKTDAAKIDAAIPEGERDAFTKTLAELPAPLQVALRAEVWSPPPANGPATAAQIARFGATEEGSALLKEWGRDAPAKVAIIRAHVARLHRRVGNPAAVEAWGQSMSAATRAALCRELTASV